MNGFRHLANTKRDEPSSDQAFESYDQRMAGSYPVVQPWGPRKGTDATFISEHGTDAEAFAEIDRLSEQMTRTGAPSDAVELIVVDAEDRIITRPGVS